MNEFIHSFIETVLRLLKMEKYNKITKYLTEIKMLIQKS